MGFIPAETEQDTGRIGRMLRVGADGASSKFTLCGKREQRVLPSWFVWNRPKP
jgi:hypothetical protein